MQYRILNWIIFKGFLQQWNVDFSKMVYKLYTYKKYHSVYMHQLTYIQNKFNKWSWEFTLQSRKNEGKRKNNLSVNKTSLSFLGFSTSTFHNINGSFSLRLTYPLRTPRIRFMTKNAPRTTMETKYINCHLFPMASWTLHHLKKIKF